MDKIIPAFDRIHIKAFILYPCFIIKKLIRYKIRLYTFLYLLYFNIGKLNPIFVIQIFEQCRTFQTEHYICRRRR
jgi:hypothetical protein